jgi:signal transduction histidine kinase
MAATATLVSAALVLPRSFRLTTLSDLAQCFLLFSGAASFVPLALRSRGRMRLFWSLITLSISLWLTYQLLWTRYEVVLRRDVPGLYAGDMVLFLNLVPLMAALALRPHVPQDEYAARLGRLDFALLLVWWFYLYLLVVTPWQYVVPNLAAYDQNLHAAYDAEKVVVVAGLAACWMSSQGHWRKLYVSLFCVSVSYSAGSTIANWAIARKTYYSGSLYDIPIVIAMAALTWVGLWTKADAPEAKGRVSSVYGVWVAGCGMIAVLSLPLLATWALYDTRLPSRIRVFRLALTLVAAFVMGVMVFFRQHRLDRELIELLDHSRNSIDTLKHLQGQILQSEKLASIGQLVAGAAHELNNPITAMLGYSDLLLATELTAGQQPLAAKIGQHARRTKALVASLISFARQAPARKTLIDLNTLARTAVKLAQPQWEPLRVEVRTELDGAVPKVLGDSNQLLQMCLQLVGNCVHIMGERGGKIMIVSSQREGDRAVLQIATELSPSTPGLHAEDPGSSLGVAACQGILQEHRAQVSCQRGDDGKLLLRVELPAAETAPESEKKTTALWQSQPFA